MAFTYEPLSPHHGFGVAISGLARGDLADADVRKELNALWIDRGVLLFRGMEPDVDLLLELSRCFGDLEIHPTKRINRPPFPGERPELIYPKFEPGGDSSLYEIEGRITGGVLPWHSDLVYHHQINRGGILRPIHLPSEGGQTGFIDQIEAYAALPDDLKRRIEGLDVIYKANFDLSQQRFGQPKGLKLISLNTRDAAANASGDLFPRVLHPMVFTQPETGRKVLNVSPWFAVGIHGMENAEGDALLHEVVAHCTQEGLAYYHSWKPDEMVLWDNWRMLHCATGVWTNERRLMERTTIAGDYHLGRLEDPEAIPHETQRVMV